MMVFLFFGTLAVFTVFLIVITHDPGDREEAANALGSAEAGVRVTKEAAATGAVDGRWVAASAQAVSRVRDIGPVRGEVAFFERIDEAGPALSPYVLDLSQADARVPEADAA